MFYSLFVLIPDRYNACSTVEIILTLTCPSTMCTILHGHVLDYLTFDGSEYLRANCLIQISAAKRLQIALGGQ